MDLPPETPLVHMQVHITIHAAKLDLKPYLIGRSVVITVQFANLAAILCQHSLSSLSVRLIAVNPEKLLFAVRSFRHSHFWHIAGCAAIASKQLSCGSAC